MRPDTPSSGHAHGAAAASRTTAGFLNTDWNPRSLPAGAVTTNVVLRTADGASTSGALYRAGSPRTVVCIMHPREFMACHYLIPDLLEAGCAAWSQAPRSVGNDIRLEHEIALFDVAASMAWLREQGFERIVLLGNSGGCGLYSLYMEQAGLAPEERLAATPAGRKTGLARLNMPQADGVVFVAPHPGQGELLMRCIDPSVADEDDPLSVVPELDPFDPHNGFREPPASSRYEEEFVRRYRAAQVERVRRLDARARALIAARLSARQRWRDGGSRADRVRGSLSPIMTVWRTDADLRNLDLSLDPSDRHYGSLWGKDPFTSNWGSVGFGRICSPESWLSTWSGLSSKASLARTVPAVRVPSLVIEYTGDQACFPSVVRDIVAALGSPDKTHLRFPGDHHGRPLREGEEPGRLAAGRAIGAWLREHAFC